MQREGRDPGARASSAAAAAAVVPSIPPAAVFPHDFMWGAATASHQVEGNNRWNDWWALEEAGRLPHRSGDACRSYELYEQDFDMARSLGQNAHRFSLEWSRIEPREGQWNPQALAHYARVIQALRDRGMEPLVTLHHFTNPQWFAERGGWVRGDSVRLFERYVAYVVAALGSQVRWWLTLNEPTVYVKRAFVAGDWPPCRPRHLLQGARALRNLMRAHRVAYDALHRARSDVMVGMAHSAPYVMPCNPRSVADRWAAYLRDFVLNRSVLALLGSSPRRSLDFLGVNYYTRQIARWRPGLASMFVGQECKVDHHDEPRHFNTLGWEVYPAGLTRVLERFGRLGLPLVITENGIATEDEDERTRFLTQHLEALRAAVAAGVDVRGYFYWSLMDNYEWVEGIGAKFGLAANDFTTQRRHPRAAAHVYAATIADERNRARADRLT